MRSRTTLLQSLSVIGVSLLLGYAVASARLELVIVVAALLLVVGVVVRPELALWVYVAVFFVLDRVVDMHLLPASTRWLPDVVLLVLLGRLLTEAMVGQRRLRLVQPVMFTVMLLFVTVTLSSIMNGYGIAGWIVGTRYYLRYPLLFLALTNTPFAVSTRRRLLALMGALFVVQLPLTAAQFAITGRPADVNSGSFLIYGGADLMFFCLVVMTVLLVHYVSSEKHPLWALAGSAVAIVPPLMAGTRVVQFLGPVVLLLALLHGLAVRGARGWGRILVVAASVTLLAIAVSQSVWYTRAVAPNLFASLRDIQAYELSGDSNQIGRLAALRYTTDVIAKNAETLVLGYGPGSLSENQFVYGRAWSLLRSGLSRSQVNTGLVEIGFGGLVALAVCLTGLAVTVHRLPKRQDDPLWTSVRMSMPVVLVLYALMALYSTVWTTNVAPFLLWVAAAALDRGGEREAASEPGAAAEEVEAASA